MTRYRAALASRDLRRLLSALLVSATGSWAYTVGLYAYIYARTHSLAWVGAAGVITLVPQLILSVPAGVLAERAERIRLMIGADLLRLVWMGLLVVIAALHGSAALALACAVLNSTTGTVYAPAVGASIPSIAGEDELAAANALNGAIDQLVVIVGPALGAILLALSSATAVFAVNAASFGLSALLVSRITWRGRRVDVTDGGQVGLLRQLTVGFRAIAADARAALLVGYCLLVTFLYGTNTVLFIAVSADRLGTGAHGWGYLLVGDGVGGLLMAAAVDRLSRSRRLSAVILLGTLGYCLPMALLIVIHSPELAFAVQILRGAATLVVDVLAIAALQRAVSETELARVFGVYEFLVFSAIGLGSILTPVLVDAVGLNAGLWIIALAPAVLALAGFPLLRAADGAGAARAENLAPLVELLDGLEIFAAASRPTLERLAASAVEMAFGPSEVIVREGDRAEALFVLADGSVHVSARGETGGPERAIRTMAAPSVFGEIGLLEEIPRTATVTAAGPCRCWQIDGTAFLDALTTSTLSGSLLAGVRTRLAVTHPSRRPAEAATSAAITG